MPRTETVEIQLEFTEEENREFWEASREAESDFWKSEGDYRGAEPLDPPTPSPKQIREMTRYLFSIR